MLASFLFLLLRSDIDAFSFIWLFGVVKRGVSDRDIFSDPVMALMGGIREGVGAGSWEGGRSVCVTKISGIGRGVGWFLEYNGAAY